MNRILFSSKKHDYETPTEVYNPLNKEFKFTLDPCCTKETAKCTKYYTKEENGLEQNWEGERVFVNPPFGRQIKSWVEKCYYEAQKKDTKVVMLIPARTDTEYFHNFIYNGKAKEIRFIKGRVTFLQNEKRVGSATFPSMIVVF